MTRRVLIGLLVVILAGVADSGMNAAPAASSTEMNKQVFRYLDSTDPEEASGLLRAMLSDPSATIDQAMRPLRQSCRSCLEWRHRSGRGQSRSREPPKLRDRSDT